MIDISRLQVQLQRTKLQNKDNALYQLLHELIKSLGDTFSEVTTLSRTPSSSSTTNNITNNYAIQSGIGIGHGGLSASSTPMYSIVNNTTNNISSNIMQLSSGMGGGLGGLHATFIPMFSPQTSTLPIFTSGSVIFAGPSGTLTQDNTSFFWDDTNNLLTVVNLTVSGMVSPLNFGSVSSNLILDGFEYGPGTFYDYSSYPSVSVSADSSKFLHRTRRGIVPSVDNTVDIGSVGTDGTPNLRYKNGYFGSYLGAPIFNADTGYYGPMLVFPATQIPSSDVNALDDYEEGTFTPSLSSSGGAGAAAYNWQTGYYVKIGKLVHVSGYINLSGHGTLPAGNIQVDGLPFATENLSGGQLIGVNIPYLVGMATAVVSFGGFLLNNATSFILLMRTGASGGMVSITKADMGNIQMTFDAIYRASN